MKKKKDTTKSIRGRMRELEKEIYKHQDLYYKKNEPEITDYNFDQLFEELKTLEEKHPELKSPNSPMRFIGSDADNTFQKREHLIPVLSLGNTYTLQELMTWAVNINKKKQSCFHVQWKLDGATLVLYYRKGRLEYALTRGTGSVGDDVTANALTIPSIPETLKKPWNIAVRGEVYMRYHDFSQFNESFGMIYANPRNLSAGSLKHKKSSEAAKRPLRWAAFDSVFLEDKKLKNKKQKAYKTDQELLKAIEAAGLPITMERVCVPLERLEETVQSFEKRRGSLGFPVDGLVIKADDLGLRQELGSTANAPRWAAAYKFTPETAVSTVIDIETSVGRTGRVTPRASLEPVQLAGSTVRYATLHNADFVKKLGVRIGSKVRITKRGDIIPAIEEVISQSGTKAYFFPEKCPSCSAKLIRTRELIDWLCPNPLCPDQILSRIIFFCGRSQMDIAHLGESVCQTLFQKGLLKSIPDIYRLKNHKQALESLTGFGARSAELLLAGIEASKKKNFRTVLVSLGLEEIGPNVTELLIEAGYDSFANLKKTGEIGKVEILEKESFHSLFSYFSNEQERLMQVNGIGKIWAEKILKQLGGFSDKKQEEEAESALVELPSKIKERLDKAGYDNDKLTEIHKKNLPINFLLKQQTALTKIKGIDMRTASAVLKQISDDKVLTLFKELESLGLNMQADKKSRMQSALFQDQIWCVTGNFIHFKPRSLALEKIKVNGGKTSSSISSQTTHLLAGSGGGTKLQKAQEKGVKIITEEEFLELLPISSQTT